MLTTLPNDWQDVVGQETEKPYFEKLEAFVDAERQKYTIYPKESEVFSSMEYTPYNAV